MDKPPAPPTIAPTDPTLLAEQQQAARDQTNALMSQAAGDTASLMARYGTRLALAGSASGSPLLMKPAAAALGRVA